MRFIFQFPETTGTETDMLDVGPLREVAIAAEQAGFYGIALTGHPVPGTRCRARGGWKTEGTRAWTRWWRWGTSRARRRA
ncbi:MAG TPA: hypothetical protein VHZ03_48580 [Trebonia sp.]|nr:hypothetical protein [Trebonia sp.]